MAAHGKLVAGECVSGADTNPNLTFSNLDDVGSVGARQSGERADALDRIGDTPDPLRGMMHSAIGRENGMEARVTREQERLDLDGGERAREPVRAAVSAR